MAKPVIMTSTGCLHLNPQEKNFGFTVEPRNTSDWASKINLLAQSPELVQKMGKTGRIIAENEFNTKRFGNDIVKFVWKILEK